MERWLDDRFDVLKQMHSRRSLLRYSIGMAAGFGLLAACGDSDDDDSDESGSSAGGSDSQDGSAPTADTSPADSDDSDAGDGAEGADGEDDASESSDGDGDSGGDGTVIIAINGDITHWNQALLRTGPSWFPSTLVFSRLAAMDYGPDFAIHPDLATAWEISDDGLTYTFHLAEGVTWHDGEPFTSNDVKVTYEGITEYAGPAAPTLEYAESIETPDDQTVVIQLKEVYAPFLDQLALYPRTPILPAHLYADTDWESNPHNESPIGTGAFKFDERVASEYVSLVRNENYFKGTPAVEQVVFRNIPDQNVQIASLRAGEVHALNDPPPLQLLAELDQSDGVVVDAPPSPMIYFLAFNVTKEPFDNPEVRKALAYAINRQQITDRITQGYYKVAIGTYVQSIEWAFNPDTRLPDYDPEQAAALLDAAGYPADGGSRFKLEIWASREPEIDTVEILREQLRQINVEVSINQLEDATLRDALNDLRHDAYIYGNWWGPDPSEWGQYTITGGSWNKMGYSNPEVDELFELGLSVQDRAERAKHYFRIQEIMLEEMPRIPIFDAGPYAFGRREEFDGWFSQDPVSFRMDMSKVKAAKGQS